MKIAIEQGLIFRRKDDSYIAAVRVAFSRFGPHRNARIESIVSIAETDRSLPQIKVAVQIRDIAGTQVHITVNRIRIVGLVEFYFDCISGRKDASEQRIENETDVRTENDIDIGPRRNDIIHFSFSEQFGHTEFRFYVFDIYFSGHVENFILEDEIQIDARPSAEIRHIDIQISGNGFIRRSADGRFEAVECPAVKVER